MSLGFELKHTIIHRSNIFVLDIGLTITHVDKHAGNLFLVDRTFFLASQITTDHPSTTNNNRNKCDQDRDYSDQIRLTSYFFFVRSFLSFINALLDSN